MPVGNGKSNVYTAQFRITGNENIPDAFTILSGPNFPGLIFSAPKNEIFEIDYDNGEFIFTKNGILHGFFSMSIGTDGGNTAVFISPEFDDGTGFSFLNARKIEIISITENQVIIVGQIEARIGNKLRFQLQCPNDLANFETVNVSNGSVIPAALLDFNLHMR